MKKGIFVLMFLLMLSCTKNVPILEKPVANDVTPKEAIEVQEKVFSSFYPFSFLANGIFWDSYVTENIVPNGGEAHEYEPTAKQMEDILKAKFVILNGLGMESYEEKLIEKIGEEKVLLLGEMIQAPLHKEEEDEKHDEPNGHEEGHGHGNIDPHTWLSPKIMLEMAKILSEKTGNKNEDFLQKLGALDASFSGTLVTCKNRNIVTSHEAFGYLARDYNLSQVAVLGISPEEEPSAKDIASIVDFVKKEKITTIFSEALVSPKFTETIASETSANVLELNAVESLTEEDIAKGEDYISIMKKNLKTLSQGLDCTYIE